jgi:hypothetical protein
MGVGRYGGVVCSSDWLKKIIFLVVTEVLDLLG